MKNPVTVILLLCSFVFSEDYWRPLFNGVDFTGWVPEGPGPLDGSAWAVYDSAIYGENTGTQPKHGICWSEQEYSDFTVRLKYKDILGNSGFYFRSEKDDGILTVAGMHVEIDPTRDAGSFYETLGRNWVERVTQAFHDSVHRENDWNDLVLEAHGTHVTSYVNGRLGVDLPDDREGRMKGYFGMQVHGSMLVEVWFKDIEMLDSNYCETDAPCEAGGQICDVEEGSPTKNSCIDIPPCTDNNFCEEPLVCDMQEGSPTKGQCIEPVIVQWPAVNIAGQSINPLYRMFKVNGSVLTVSPVRDPEGLSSSADGINRGVYFLKNISKPANEVKQRVIVR